MARLILTLLLVIFWILLCYSTDIPKSFGSTVRFAGTADAAGEVNEARFLKIMFLAANELRVTDKPQPYVLLVHMDKKFGDTAGVVPEKDNAVLWYPNIIPGVVIYEVWYVDGLTDQQSITFIAKIYQKAFDFSDETLEVMAKVVMTELKSTVDVHDLKR